MRPDAANALPAATRCSCERISATCTAVHAVISATPRLPWSGPILPDAGGEVTHWQLLADGPGVHDRAHVHLMGARDICPWHRLGELRRLPQAHQSRRWRNATVAGQERMHGFVQYRQEDGRWKSGE